MQVEVIIKSARELKNVNWRYGMPQPYAIVWIDTTQKYSTKIDQRNGSNPVWNEKFTIPFPPTSRPEIAILYIDVVHANAVKGTKPLIGSSRFPLRVALAEAQSNGNAQRSLNLERPSSRPQGTVEIKIKVIDSSNINNGDPYRQGSSNRPLQSQPQSQIQPLQFQVQPQPQIRPPQPQAQLQLRPQLLPQFHLPQPQPRHQNQAPRQPQPQLYPQPQSKLQPQQPPINHQKNQNVVRPSAYPRGSPQVLRPMPLQGPQNGIQGPTSRPDNRPIMRAPARQNFQPGFETVPTAKENNTQVQESQVEKDTNNISRSETTEESNNEQINDNNTHYASDTVNNEANDEIYLAESSENSESIDVVYEESGHGNYYDANNATMVSENDYYETNDEVTFNENCYEDGVYDDNYEETIDTDIYESI